MTPTRARPTAAWFTLALAACGGSGAGPHSDHAPVDPALDLAIAVPDTMKRVEADFVIVERSERFDTAAAWAADVQAHNRSYRLSDPTPDGDGWVITMTSTDPYFGNVRLWYRPLAGGFAITCAPITGTKTASAEQIEVGRKVCFGTQHVGGRIYVPFQMSRTEKRPHLELAIVGEPLNWSVDLERVADSPQWRFDPKGVGGNQKLVDEGKLADGSWWISTGRTSVGPHYDTVTRRTIGGLELACAGDSYRDEEYTRRQLALCLALEKP